MTETEGRQADVARSLTAAILLSQRNDYEGPSSGGRRSHVEALQPYNSCVAGIAVIIRRRTVLRRWRFVDDDNDLKLELQVELVNGPAP
jgi:hypothetical protein